MWVWLLAIVSENVSAFSQLHEAYARTVLGLAHDCSFPVHRSPFINSINTDATCVRFVGSEIGS
jgi:hypothetical protein